ncbi:MAG: hypothetical protein A3I68_02395 [Candidatus Melainabacteria bacterium RIFCSPLOWO2_02_FULL_35_15]|nr:MAG: hypothetical protein A3F80_00470 [Candidatus Melainabacteria bacterium RIFCSPLOWO2_12_FULL_35_11]OGI13257.1 MAG: hypothetical protein A3I68_02395 [Candidatus Melainabacteria bacterium RIFCSPLOWO2_02_FULL_35_15]
MGDSLTIKPVLANGPTAKLSGPPDNGQKETVPPINNQAAIIPLLERSGVPTSAYVPSPDTTSDFLLVSDSGKVFTMPVFPNGKEISGIKGNYTIIERVGIGGVGEVYKAKNNDTGEFAAVKVVSLENRHNPVVVARFLKEIEITNRLQHPGIIRIIDLEKTDGKNDQEHPPCFLVMPYIEGGSLEQELKKNHKINPIDVVKIAIGISDALDHAHRQRPSILHRDIKPGNIMLDDKGNPILVDFNIGSIEDASTINPTGQELPKTYHYMSPEQARGIGKEQLPPATDLFSLGSTMFHLVTGEYPFTGDKPGIVSTRIQDPFDYPKLPHEINPEVPLELSVLIMDIMAKDYQDREDMFPQGALSVKQRLCWILSDMEKDKSTSVAA